MSKHTPGPWSIETGHEMKGNGTYWQIHDGSDAICCNQFCYGKNSFDNAQLIAAAPDLLEALKYAAQLLEHGGFDMSKIDAAIAKAEGRSND